MLGAKKEMKMKKTALQIAALLLVAGSLQASTVTYTNIVTMNNNLDAVVNLAKFDVSLGTLTGIYLEYVSQISGANVQMDNDSTFAQQGTAIVQNTVKTFSSSVSLAGTGIVKGDMAVYEENIFNLGATSSDTVGVFNNTGNSDYATWSPGMLAGIGSGNVDSSVWAQYQGAGTFNATIKSVFITSASFDGSDGYFQGNTPNGTFSGTVTYTYSPIPEPASASMAILVLIAGFWVRRRFID